MGLIIVEGPDGSGKTTLLRTLRERSKTYFWVASSSRRPGTVQQLRDAMHWIGQASYLALPVVCDRLPLISESIYGPILRGSSLVDSMDRRTQAEYIDLLTQCKKVIYCRPPIDTIIANLDKNPQLTGVKDKIRALVDRYDDFMESLRDDNIYVHHYDYTRHTLGNPDETFFGRV